MLSAREERVRIRTKPTRCMPNEVPGVITSSVNARALVLVRNGSFEMPRVTESHCSPHRAERARGARMLRLSQRSHLGGVRTQANSSLLLHKSKATGSTVFRQRTSLRIRSVAFTDDTSQLAGSASFFCNSAWCGCCGVTGVHYLLTGRIILQYMRCNGVGGSTC